MKKALLTLVMLLALFLSVASATLTPVNCNEWYNYGSVQFPGIVADKPQYSPGDTVKVTSNVWNNNPIPIVGDVRARIYYKANATDYLLEERIFKAGVSLAPNGTAPISGEWQVPANLKSGEYRIALYFTVADSFNMGGVAFLNRMYGDVTDFKVAGGADLIYFDTEGTTANGVRKPGSEPIAVAYAQGEPITFKVPIVNDGAAVGARVVYELYHWEDLRNGDLLQGSVKQDTVELPVGKTEVSYTVSGDLAPGVYLLKMTAVSTKNKAIAKIRIPVGGVGTKVNFAGIDRFPVVAGEAVKVGICVSNPAQNNIAFFEEEDSPARPADRAEVTIILRSGGRELLRETSSVPLQPSILGYEAVFTPKETYGDIELEAVSDITGLAGRAARDSAKITYSFKDFVESVDLALDVSVAGDVASFDITASALGRPFSGPLTLYIENLDTGAAQAQAVNASGSAKATERLENGRYKATVVEQGTGSSAVREFAVSYTPPTPPAKEAAADSTPLVLILLAAIVVIGLFAAWKKGLLGGRSSEGAFEKAVKARTSNKK